MAKSDMERSRQPESAALDLWLRRDLMHRFGPASRDAVPGDLIELIEQLPLP